MVHRPLATLRVGVAVFVVALQLAGVIGPLAPALAAPGESCFMVSDGNDTLYRYNYDGPTYQNLGPTGRSNIEAISWDPVNSILYAMDAGQLGTLNQSNGSFTAIGADSGLDMDGLAIDPFTGVAYGAIRRADGQSGGSGVYDDLATISLTTGVVTIVGPMGSPVDDSGDALYDVDDLAFDPTTGALWGVANAGGNDTLIVVSKFTGVVLQSVGEFGPTDVEGLSWNDIGGLRGTTGGGAQLWDINPVTAVSSNPISLSPGSDFESLGCFRVAGPLSNTITGTVFLDADVNATFGAGDTGTISHTLNLWRDVNGDGVLTNADDVTGDGLLTALDILNTTTSDASGFYSFIVGASRAFIVGVVPSTLPAGSRLTTVGLRAINFGNSYGLTDPNNDFGYTIPAVTLTKSTSTPVIDAGDTAVYSYALANTGAEPFPVARVTLADNACAPVTGPTSGDNGNSVLDPGETWMYGCSTSLTQDTTNTATATVVPAVGPNLVPTDMEFVDVRPTIVVTKTEGVATIPEPGGSVTFTITVENTSAENVTINTISDSDFGNVLDGGNPLVTATTCLGGTVVLPGPANTYSCTFAAAVSGDSSGPAHSNTVTVGASDNEGNTATDNDDATVSFTDVLPTIVVTKTEGVASINEPGGTITFAIDIENTSPESVTLTALTDSDFGNLFTVTGTTCLAGTVISIGATYSCSFDGLVSGDAAGPDHFNTATATAVDNEGNAVNDNDDATVTFLDVPPSITVTKTPSPTEVPAAGASVTFTVRVDNTSPETLNLTILSDSIYGDVSDGGNLALTGTTCSLPQALTVGGFYQCTFTAFVAGPAGGSETDTVTATASDNDGNSDIESDDAIVAFGSGSVGDFVWLDLDGDGVQDGGAEAGITGVTVDLYADNDSSGTLNAGDVLVGTDTTDGSGNYDFTGLLPGDYLVTVTDPGGVIPSSTLTGGTDPHAVALAAGVDYNSADFGYQPFVTVGDRVWLDVNGNGWQDGAEATGLAGVTASLIDPGLDTVPGTLDDVIVDTDVTNSGGNYLLTGPAGTYVVEFTGLPAGYILSPQDQGGDDTVDSDADPASAFTASFTLSGGQAILTVDAGAFLPATIGDRVFVDLDADGFFDAGEGIPNMTVTLSDGQSTATDADGFYEFIVVAGSYTVTVDELDVDFPASALQTVGTNPQPVAVVAGETNDTIDFGYIIAGPGILLKKDPGSQTILTGSDADFTITVTNIGNVTLTGVTVVDALVSACDTTIASLLPGAVVSYPCSATGVTLDFTNSATATGTPPIGIDVTSTDTADVDVIDPSITITKDPASQTILVGTDATFTITVTNTGDVDLNNVVVADPLAVACDNAAGLLPVAGVVSYSCDATAVPADFTNTATVNADGPLGPLPPASDTADVIVDEAVLSGRVWLDLNGDSIQDPGEPGAGGVPVVLLDSLLARVASTVTDGNGDYLFDGLAGDDYTVQVDSSVLPVGTVATEDPDGLLDDETAKTVVLGDNIAGLDFGYRPPATVTGLVFVDDDGDAVQDPSELPLPGVTVFVTDSSGVRIAVVTDAAGVYSAGVLAGPVTIDVDDPTVPADHALTTANDPQVVTAVSGVIVTAPDIGYQPLTVDLSLTKTSTEGNVQAGDDAEWLLIVANVGATDAIGTITVTDNLPEGLNYVSAGGSGWTCGAVGSVVTCQHPGPLATGASLEVRILTSVDDDLSGTINNEAVVSLVGDAVVVNNFAVAGIGLLPNTGFNLGDALKWSLLSLVFGAGLILATRRRDDDQDLVKNS